MSWYIPLQYLGFWHVGISGHHPSFDEPDCSRIIYMPKSTVLILWHSCWTFRKKKKKGLEIDSYFPYEKLWALIHWLGGFRRNEWVLVSFIVSRQFHNQVPDFGQCQCWWKCCLDFLEVGLQLRSLKMFWPFECDLLWRKMFGSPTDPFF